MHATRATFAGLPAPSSRAERPTHGIPCGGNQGRHIQYPPNGGATAPAGAAAPPGAAVAIERGDPDQGRQLFGGQCAEFGEFCQEGSAHHGANARHATQQISFSRHTGSARIICVRSFSSWASWWASHARCAWICWCTRRGAPLRRCCSAVRISSRCRRRVSSARNSWVASSAIGRGVGRTASAHCANTAASNASSWASAPWPWRSRALGAD